MASAKRLRLTVTVQPSGKSSVLIVQSLDDLRRQCTGKFRLKSQRLFLANSGEELLTDLSQLPNDTKLIVTGGDLYVPVISASAPIIHDTSSIPIRVIANRTLVEQIAVDQLNNVAKIYAKVKQIWGMPDLHAGQATPIGCVVATDPSVIYPELIGSDIGCGMSFVRTSLRLVYEDDERRLTKWTRQLQGLDDYLPMETIEQYLREDLQWPTTVEKIIGQHSENEQLGTIGAGNHFVELQRIEELYDEQQSDLSKDHLYLLVHSGSRSLGERFLREFGKDKEHGRGLEQGTDSYQTYLNRHDEACAWAKRNRALIARRFLDCLGDSNPPHCLLDIWHNNVVVKQLDSDQSQVHLHRKGAAPSDRGRVVIPGSRGTHSYLVEPLPDDPESSGYSLAHGAGRAMSRSKARQQFTDKYPDAEQLKITDTLDSHVVCDDKQLLYEEHPQAYKTIDAVIDDLVEAKLIRVLAKLRPLITYKTRFTHRE